MMKSLELFAVLFLCMASLSACMHPAQMPSRDTIVRGETITVKGNQSVYAVARENDVSMREIIVLNNLKSPFNLEPGQSLILPANKLSGEISRGYTPQGSYGSQDTHGSVAPQPAAMPSGSVEEVPLAPIQTAPLAAPKSETKQNSFNQSSVTSAPIENLNQPASAPKALGTTASGTTTQNTKLTNVPQAQVVSPPPTAPSPAPVPPPVASAPQASEPPGGAPTKINMVWPVQGPIVSAFGSKGQGLNNDGINIGAPKGAPVIASSNGIVVYAGNEMKGFGNLILIRHQDGWVTAYAHLDRMLVNKDGVVAQGDMIGTVGKTGNVPSPQLHFETRYEGKPVDPSTVIKTQ